MNVLRIDDPALGALLFRSRVPLQLQVCMYSTRLLANSSRLPYVVLSDTLLLT